MSFLLVKEKGVGMHKKVPLFEHEIFAVRKPKCTCADDFFGKRER
jgi:hypothetical protein